MTDEKICVKCGVQKPLTEFYKQAGLRDGHRNDCKACIAKRVRENYRRNPEPFIRRTQRWRARHPKRYQELLERNRTVNRERRREQARVSHLRRAYGLSIEVYGFLCVAQANRCAVCRTEVEKLHVDHEHGTGRVRGLLCGKCNKAIGLLNDDPELLRVASRYLERTQLPLGCGDSTPVRRRGRPPGARDALS
ncbi:MAG: endonuclease VII domain-containing protein [Actinomycetota bacterium]